MEAIYLEHCVNSTSSFSDGLILITINSRLFALMALGYRIEAISILAREVMLPRGLVGLGFDSIDLCGPEIAEVDPSFLFQQL
jgi:hypothetical protein